jgi:hypothetical protein
VSPAIGQIQQTVPSPAIEQYHLLYHRAVSSHLLSNSALLSTIRQGYSAIEQASFHLPSGSVLSSTVGQYSFIHHGQCSFICYRAVPFQPPSSSVLSSAIGQPASSQRTVFPLASGQCLLLASTPSPVDSVSCQWPLAPSEFYLKHRFLATIRCL